MLHKLTTPVPLSSPLTRTPAELFPLVLAFIAISFAFGATAREAHLSFVATVLMSAFVYAGTSQVVALGLLAAHQPAWLIIVVTLLINSRMLLMGLVTAERVVRWKPAAKLLFAFQLTDETFALLLPPPGVPFSTPERALKIQIGAHGAWIAGTIVGFGVGADTALIKGLGLDFALVAMILAVLVFQLRDLHMVLVAVFSGAIALCAVKVGLGWMSTLLAALLAPLLGIFLERRCLSRKSSLP